MVTMESSPVSEKKKNGEFRAALDPIHGGIKLAEMGTFIGGGVFGYIGTSLLIANPLLAAGVGLGLAVGGSIGIGRYLKSNWPSGRELIADAEHIALIKGGKNQTVLQAEQQVNVLTWYFEVKKDHPRARKGWYLLGLGLEQNDSYIIVYTAVPPKTLEDLPLAKHFSKLERGKNSEKATESASAMRRAGEQRRLYEAEVLRQLDGGDMESSDFLAFLDFMQATYPRWMIS